MEAFEALPPAPQECLRDAGASVMQGMTAVGVQLANNLLLKRDRAGAAGRTLDAVAELANINLQLSDGAAEGVTVHSQFTGGPALVALVFLKHGQDEALLELAHALGIKNIASVHLQDKCFQLIFHDAFLSLL